MGTHWATRQQRLVDIGNTLLLLWDTGGTRERVIGERRDKGRGGEEGQGERGAKGNKR